MKYHTECVRIILLEVTRHNGPGEVVAASVAADAAREGTYGGLANSIRGKTILSPSPRGRVLAIDPAAAIAPGGRQ